MQLRRRLERIEAELANDVGAVEDTSHAREWPVKVLTRKMDAMSAVRSPLPPVGHNCDPGAPRSSSVRHSRISSSTSAEACDVLDRRGQSTVPSASRCQVAPGVLHVGKGR